MKAVGIVILLPLISVVIVSLYIHEGASRIAALVLLAVSVVGFMTGLVWKRTRRRNDSKVVERTSR